MSSLLLGRKTFHNNKALDGLSQLQMQSGAAGKDETFEVL
jgi:hypothetical protein